MRLALIYARSENRCIGADGRLPWHLPDEFAHFKRTTMGRPIIMGRKTYEDHQSALPGRTNIVISRQPDYRPGPGIVLTHSLEQALEPYRQEPGEVFVIGGAGLLEQAFPGADRVYETVVHANIPGDTFLAPLDLSNWTERILAHHPPDDRHPYAFTVYQYERP